MAKSTRMTRTIKEAILREALNAQFNDEADRLCKEFKNLANRVYTQKYPPEMWAKMCELSKGWLPEVDSTRAQFGKSSGFCILRFNGVYPEFRKASRLYPDKIFMRVRAADVDQCSMVLSSDDVLSKLYHILRGQAEAAYNQERHARGLAWNVLNSVTTVKRLIEVWPEIEPFAKPWLARPASLPAVQLSEVNDALGLS